MRSTLVVVLAAVSWVYLVEACKTAKWCVWLHYRTGSRLQLVAVLGAVLIGLGWRVWHPFAFTVDVAIVMWAAWVIEQAVYDGIVHRPRLGGIR